MPLYPFADQHDRYHELWLPMDEAPAIGTVLIRSNLQGHVGETLELRRLPSVPGASVEPDWRIVAESLPPNTPGADHYTEDGTPCFASKRRAEEVAAQQGLTFKR